MAKVVYVPCVLGTCWLVTDGYRNLNANTVEVTWSGIGCHRGNRST
jgi:hypothetical protein